MRNIDLLFYVVIPVVANFTMAATVWGIIYLDPTFEVGPLMWALVILITISALSVFPPYASGALEHGAAWAGIILNLVAIISLFAAIHMAFGICCETVPGDPPKDLPVKDIALSFYFSIVTLTTLGYGDFSPVDYGRYFAAGQALIGYGYLGMIVSAGFSWAQNYHQRNGNSPGGDS